MRYYIGWIGRMQSTPDLGEASAGGPGARRCPSHGEGFAAVGPLVDEHRGRRKKLWAAIKRPDGRVVDFLLDHGWSGSP